MQVVIVVLYVKKIGGLTEYISGPIHPIMIFQVSFLKSFLIL